jgi:hypothetical protein
MRAVLVLLVLGLAAWGLYVYLPTSNVEGKVRADEPAIPFLERPEDAAEPAPRPGEAGPSVRDAEVDWTPPEPAAPARAFGLAAQEASSGAAQDVGLAQALLFGGPTDVERALARLDVPDAERRLALAFALAAAGNRKAAIETAQGLDAPDALPAADRALLEGVLTGKPAAVAVPAGTGAEPVVRRAMRLRLRALEADRLLAQGEHAPAARAFSELLKAALVGPWEGERAALLAWSNGLNAAQARHRWDPRGEWPSAEVAVEAGDTPTHVRKRYLAEHPDGLVCTGLIARANQITGYIHPGDTLRIPTDRASVLVDLSSRWLLYLLGDEVAGAWEVGVGKDGQETIAGEFRAADKLEEPTWFRAGQEPRYYPDNPLGTRWIAWYRDGQKTGYGIHGTWEPESIGTAASDGCIRLRNADVELLFEILPVGARITVQN